MTFESLPSVEQLENELRREKRRKNYGRALRSTIFTLIVVAAIAILIIVLFLPVLQITGSSMLPNLKNGDVVVAVNTGRYTTGDVIAFYYNNNLMVKRIVGTPGDIITIDDDGVVYRNGEMLGESYLQVKDAGVHDIDYPFTVPDNSYFVLGDNRYMSDDSRKKQIGCVDSEFVAGKLYFRIWPFGSIGLIK